jgi:hypothetical protein
MFDRLDAEETPSPPNPQPRPLAVPSAGTSLTLPGGQIAGELRPITLEPGRAATYELAVANETPLPLAAFSFAAVRPDDGPIVWSSVTVPPWTSTTIPVVVPIRSRAWPARVAAELHNGTSHVTIEASPPRRVTSPKTPALVPLLSAALIFSLIAFAYLFLRPHVLALAAPDAVEGGKPFSVVYALWGNGKAGYTVEVPGGPAVGGGSLPAGSGAFPLTLPAGPSVKGYDVRVFARGPLGTDARIAHVVALAPPPVASPPDARIALASLQHGVVESGQPIVVHYRTSATDGSVQLVDQQGIVRTEALLASSGNAILLAPRVARAQDFRVILRAFRGSSSSSKRLALRVEPPSPAVASREADGGVLPPADPASAPTVVPGLAATEVASASEVARDPIALTASAFVSGSPVAVSVLRHERDLRVALMDMTGSELSGVAVDLSRQTVRLTAPRVSQSGRYLVVATFSGDSGQETVVRPITVGPR